VYLVPTTSDWMDWMVMPPLTPPKRIARFISGSTRALPWGTATTRSRDNARTSPTGSPFKFPKYVTCKKGTDTQYHKHKKTYNKGKDTLKRNKKKHAQAKKRNKRKPFFIK
jgi:hypothetical protein